MFVCSSLYYSVNDMISCHVDLNKDIAYRRAQTQCHLEGSSRRVQKPSFLESNHSLMWIEKYKAFEITHTM